jgi:hypothetical protein
MLTTNRTESSKGMLDKEPRHQPGCHIEVSGVPPNLELLPFLMLYYIGSQKLSSSKGAANFIDT